MPPFPAMLPLGAFWCSAESGQSNHLLPKSTLICPSMLPATRAAWQQWSLLRPTRCLARGDSAPLQRVEE